MINKHFKLDLIKCLSFDEIIKLKIMSPRNIFESFRFCYFLNKLSGNLFVTIKQDKFGNFHPSTSPWDFVIFFCSFSFAFYNVKKVSDSSLKIMSSSVIIELAVHFNDKITYFKFLLAIILNFATRYTTFKILSNLNWIDFKVKLLFCKSIL